MALAAVFALLPLAATGLPILLVLVLNFDLVGYVAHAHNGVGDVFGCALHLPVIDGTLEGHVAIVYFDLDGRGVEPAVLGEAFVDVFAAVLTFLVPESRKFLVLGHRIRYTER